MDWRWIDHRRRRRRHRYLFPKIRYYDKMTNEGVESAEGF